VSWYGLADSHELDRRRWAADERQFEICVLSPYCGLVENAVKALDVSEQSGYVELQLRRAFRVPDHRRTRLWICEKSRHSRFLPLLDRSQALCFHVSGISGVKLLIALFIYERRRQTTGSLCTSKVANVLSLPITSLTADRLSHFFTLISLK